MTMTWDTNDHTDISASHTGEISRASNAFNPLYLYVHRCMHQKVKLSGGPVLLKMVAVIVLLGKKKIQQRVNDINLRLRLGITY